MDGGSSGANIQTTKKLLWKTPAKVLTTLESQHLDFKPQVSPPWHWGGSPEHVCAKTRSSPRLLSQQFAALSIPGPPG